MQQNWDEQNLSHIIIKASKRNFAQLKIINKSLNVLNHIMQLNAQG